MESTKSKFYKKVIFKALASFALMLFFAGMIASFNDAGYWYDNTTGALFTGSAWVALIASVSMFLWNSWIFIKEYLLKERFNKDK